MFHQMREKADESRNKDKQEDYKMHILKTLMEKNRMLEEIEHKIDKVEGGDDPVQLRLLDKIE